MLTAVLVCAARPTRTPHIVTAVRRDAPVHPSPNAGVAEAAFAAALGVELGGPTRYPTHLEDRPRLGTGPRPTVADIERAAGLADQVEWLLVALLLTGALARARTARRGGDPTHDGASWPSDPTVRPAAARTSKGTP